MKKEEIIERYGIEAYQKQLEHSHKWREKNLENIKEYNRKYYQENTEKHKESCRKWIEKNPEKIKEYQKEYNKTPMGRADKLAQNYKRNDKEHNRDKCTLTSKWIVEYIFNSQCVYCGESDWQKLGCDRIDNDLPHTPDNVVCSCAKCNRERGTRTFAEFLEYKIREREK